MSDRKPPPNPNRIIKRRAPGGGRKVALVGDEETLKRIRALGNIQCTQLEAAGVMHVCEKTFCVFLQENEKAKEAWIMGREEGKASLRRIQWKQAEKSATMAIWLGKQWLGQKDKTSISGDPDAPPIGVEHSLSAGMTALIMAARSSKKKIEDK